jgi:hypothetical protein
MLAATQFVQLVSALIATVLQLLLWAIHKQHREVEAAKVTKVAPRQRKETVSVVRLSDELLPALPSATDVGVLQGLFVSLALLASVGVSQLREHMTR